MASSIATGSMVLSLNAEKLYDGLKKAASKTADTARSITKSFGGKAGGMFGGLLSGLASAGKWIGKGGALAVGFVAVTAAVEGVKFAIEGIGKGIEYVVGSATELRDRIKEGTFKTDPGTSSGINSAATAVEKIKKIFDDLTARIVSKLAPVFNLVADAIEEWAPRLSPIIDWLASALGDVVAIGIELFNAFTDGAGMVIDEFTNWIGKTFELSDAWPTFQTVVLEVLRAIGKAGAYTWDTLKAGVGVVAVGVGVLIQGFRKLVEAFQAVVSLARNLPDSLKPPGLNEFTAGVDAFRGSVEGTGAEVQAWGQAAISEFGNSAARVDEFIDGIATRATERRARAAREAGEIATAFDPDKAKVGAVTAGSKEFASISARFKTEGLFNPQVRAQQGQLEEARRATAALNRVERAVRDISVEEFNML